MTALTLTPTDGTELDMLDPDAVMLLREGSEGVLPVPVFDEEYAESPDTEGGRRIRSRPQNPTGTGRVMISGATSEAMWANVAAWQETAEAVRRDGGVLAYTPPDGTEVSYDLDSFSITAMPQDVVAVEQAGYAISEFTFTAMPFGRLDAVTVDAGTTSSDGIFEITYDATAITGSADALGFLTLEDNASVARDHFEYGLDPDYDAVADAPIVAEYDDLVISGHEGTVASDGGNNVLSAMTWTDPVVICETAPYAHKRRWRIRARMRRTTQFGTIYARLRWKAGDDGGFSANEWVELAADTQWYDLDLGTIQSPATIQGDQEWTGRIEAYSTIPGEGLYLDYLYFIPAYRYGKARVAYRPSTPAVYSILEPFSSQTAGDISTQAMYRPAAQTWTGHGDTPDMQIDATNDWAYRDSTSDPSSLHTDARKTRAGTTVFSEVAISVDFTWSHRLTDVRSGLFARWVSSDNFLALYFEIASDTPRLVLTKVVAGTETTLATSQIASLNFDTWYTLQLEVAADGWVYGYMRPTGAALGTPEIVTYDSVLATGGAIDDGPVGFLDHHPAADICTRTYDNFAAWVPERRHVINADQSTQIRHDAVIQQSTNGAGWTKIPSEGSYLKMPPNRAGRVVVKVRGTDVDELVDQGGNSTIASLVVIPRVVLLG